jgi:hypothetical protein
MQHRHLIAGSFLLAATVAFAPVAFAQTPHHIPERTGRCFTPVTHDGVYFLVTAGGSTEQILRAEPGAGARRVTHSAKHSQVHVTARARVRVPGPESNFDGELFTRTEKPRAHAPVIHSMQFRDTAKGAVDVLVNTAIGSTGCRLRLR